MKGQPSPFGDGVNPTPSMLESRIMLPSGIVRSLEILGFQNALARQKRNYVEETFRRFIGVLDRVGTRWALVGAHAVNVFSGRPRATVDVDFVVDARRLQAILEAVRAEFGELDTVDLGAALRITNLSVDLIRSDNHPLFRLALELAEDREGIRIPPPELLLVLKFLAAVSPWRNVADRKQDVADLIRLVQTLGEDLDRQTAEAYARQAYPGAERELAAALERIDRGEDISL